MVTKNGTEIWFSQDNEEKPHTFTKNIVRVTASPSSSHHLLSYLTYLYPYLYVKRGRKKIGKKINNPSNCMAGRYGSV